MAESTEKFPLEAIEHPTYFCVDDRGININDPKWAHPELTRWWAAGGRNFPYNFTSPNLDPDKAEERMAALDLQMLGKNGRKAERTYDNGAYMKAYEGHGCPEEPETDVRVEVVYPKGYDASKKNPVMFHPVGGGVWMNYPSKEATHCHPDEDRTLPDSGKAFTATASNPKGR